MAKLNVKDLPSIMQRPGMEVTPVSLDEVKNTGVGLTQSGIAVGDVIEFEDRFEDMVITKQPIRAGSDRYNYRVLVSRNGKNAWLSLGTLTRRYNDEQNGVTPTCKFTEEMNKMENNEERLRALAGKKIKGVSSKNLRYQKFDRQTGVMLEGQFEERATTLIEYA